MKEESSGPPRRRRTWPWVLGSIAGVLALVLCGWVAAVSRARTILREAHAEALVELEKLQQRDWSRPPLGGVALEGNAWDDYRQHLPAFTSLNPDDEAVLPILHGEFDEDKKPDDEAIARVLARLKPSLDGMKRGAQRRTGNPGPRLEYPYGKLDFRVFLNFSKVIADLSQHLFRTGQHKEAADLLALGWSVSRDAMQGSPYIGLLIRAAIDGHLAWVLEDTLAKNAPPPDALGSVAAELDRIAPNPREREQSWRTEALVQSFNLADSEGPFTLGFAEPSALAPARSGFSWSIERARILALVRSEARQLHPILPLPTSQALRAARQLTPDLMARRSDADRLGDPSRILQREAEGEMLRHLARMAIALARYQHERGVFPSKLEDLVPKYLSTVPVCPLSGQPFHTRDGAVWSVGADGVDNGGTSAPGGNDPQAEGTDVVFSVRPR